MRKIFFYFALALMPMVVSAQQETTSMAVAVGQSAPSSALSFGYFSYDEVFYSMPGYAIAKRNIEELRSKYDAETKRTEDEFNAKYEEFLDGQRTFAPSILEKRQAEIRELMEKNVAFKAEAERLLQQAEKSAYAPLRNKIAKALQKIGKSKGYAFILNTDGNAMPYVDAAMGEDITTLIKENVK